jgi:hypothetical protein
MVKKEEDQPGYVPLNERKDELEKEVKYFLSLVPEQPKVTKRYSRNTPLTFKDKREEQEWQMLEIQKCQTGFDGLCGKMYFWLNYATLRDVDRGKIAPDFRTIDKTWFEFLEEQQKSKEWGIVSIKRRRIGASVRAACDVLHDSIFTPYFQTGMNSKTETDSRNLFKHVKFIYQNLPDWLRPKTTASDRRDFLEFAWYEKDGMGNRKKMGLQSSIFTTAPVDNAYEGHMLNKLIIDEAGKIPNLLTIWQYAEDCLRSGTTRSGMVQIAGTVGEIDSTGAGIREMWVNSDVYKLKKFPQFAYNGLMVDELGNCDVESSIRWVIYERERLKSATRKVRESFLQRYPLCEKDAFNTSSDGGIGNPILINDQIVKLTYNPPQSRTGWMRPKPDGGVDFVPNPEGKIIVYETPHPNRINGYCAGADPADSDSKKKKAGNDVSDLALAIVAKPFGVEPPKLVLEYVDRPEKLDGFFEQSAMALKWYNNTKVLIEDNRARMLNYFKTNYPHLLPLVPVSMLTARGGYEMKNSITMTEGRKQQGIGLVEDNIDHYCSAISSVKLLEQFKVFGDLHADDDLAMAYLLAMIMLQADKKVVKTSDEQVTTSSHQYKNVNGVIRLVTTGQPQRRFTLPKHPILNK